MSDRLLVTKPSESSDKRTALPKLPVGPVNDPLEREADRVADRVLLQPNHAAGPRGSHADASPSQGEAPLGSGGRPLDASTRDWFEPRFGFDFSKVRIHSGEEAAASARSVGAVAYTAGSQIAFDEAQYRPGTATGRRLLAHELTHVVQQGHAAALPGNGGVRPSAGQVGPRIQRDVPRDQQPRSAGETPRSPTLGLGSAPQLSLGGHTIAGDTQSAQNLLQSQLTVGPMMQPTYLGAAMTLSDISAMLGRVTPALTEQARWSLVQSAWWQKVSEVRQLPPLLASPLQLAMPSGSSSAGAGAATPSSRGTTGVLPSPQQAAANYMGTGLPDRAANSGISSQAGSGAGATPGNWQPSVGPQVVINIGRGPGTPLTQVAGQRQYTLGDNLQVVFQDSTDAASRQYSAAAGGQALSPSMIDSQIVQLQAFTQLLAGLSQMPGSFSATMTVQWSAGLQLTLKFGPITIQLSAGVQATAQPGQGVQSAFAFAATVGPTNPAPGTGSQAFGPRNNWSIGVGPPPPLPGRGGSGDRPLGGGMVYFGGNLPSWMQ